MPDVLTKSWELSIKNATQHFVSNLMTIYSQAPQKMKPQTFKRGATRFITKR